MRPLRLLLPLLFISAASLMADTVTLKTGEQVTGTIKSQTDTDVTMEVQISASITDERTIEKADIAKIDQVQPDEVAYQQLSQLQPNPAFSYASASYDQILGNLNQFLNTYPNSAHVPDIKKLAAAFEDEKKHVDAGEVKFAGAWLSNAEAVKRSVQINGMQVYGTMQQQAAGGDLVGAMQTFATIDRVYKGTRIYPVAVNLAQQILARLIPSLSQREQALKADQAQMQQTIIATSEPEKSNLIARNRDAQNRNADIISNAVRRGVKWVPMLPDSQVSLDTLSKLATPEAQRLAAIPVAAMMQSIAKTDAARAQIAAKNYTGANDSLNQATQLWSQNEDARYMLDDLKTVVASAHATPVAVSPKPLMVARSTPAVSTQTATADATPEAAAAEPAKPFFMTVPGALAIVVGVLVLAGLVSILGKKKDEE